MAIQEDNLLKNVISHAKEYGFIFPSSEIYDGLSAVYDYGQNGAELKNNIKEYWWKFMTLLHDNIVGIDAAICTLPPGRLLGTLTRSMIPWSTTKILKRDIELTF
jgi:glycyl-tRNA synthetase